MDALAVTLSAPEQYIGVAALGTSLTPGQARHLASWDRNPIIATDSDHSGARAAERDYWLLTAHGLDPLALALPPDHDPASVFTAHGLDILAHNLRRAGPLAERLLHQALNSPHPDPRTIADVIAARPADTWHAATWHAAAALNVGPAALARHVIHAANTWTTDPARAAERRLIASHERPKAPAISPVLPAVHYAGAHDPSDRGRPTGDIPAR